MISRDPDGAAPRGNPSGQVRGRLPVDPDLPERLMRRQLGLGRPARRRPDGRRRRIRFGDRWDVYLAIAAGGGLGGLARWAVEVLLPTPAGHFPWATLLVNTLGSFLLGLLMVFILEVWPPNRYARPFLAVGLLGGFTTFSTYAVESGSLVAHGFDALADAYVLSTLAAGLVAVWLGIVFGRLLSRRPVRRGLRTARSESTLQPTERSRR